MNTEQNNAQLHPFDAPFYEVEINVSPDPEKEILVGARLRPTTIGQEVARENDSVTGFREAGKNEETIVVKEDKANSNLFDATCFEVRGYRLPGEPKEASKEWREATPELLAGIPGSHKTAFLSGTRHVSMKYDAGEDEGFVIGGTGVLTVVASFPSADGEATVTFELPEPTEKEREEYTEASAELRQFRGERKRFTRVLSNVRHGVELFDALMARPGANIVGASVNGVPFPVGGQPLAILGWISKIEPWIKLRVLATAFRKYNARLSD